MISSGLLPPRPAYTHKGEVGHVLVIAGSAGLTGAAALCSLGALRVGAGRVTLAIPKSLQDVMAGKLTEVMTVPLPETKARTLSLAALPRLLSLLERVDVVALGPGLSQHAQTTRLVRQLLPKITKPCVVDADGLNAIAEEPQMLARVTRPIILTPHPGEMGRLIGQSAEHVQRDRERIVKEFATHHRMVVVLKGHRSLVANVDGELSVNDTGHPGMASGGMGDVLTGLIAGLLGQQVSPFDAARLGVYLHGLAADLVAKEQGSVGLLASDVLATIPRAIQLYQVLPT